MKESTKKQTLKEPPAAYFSDTSLLQVVPIATAKATIIENRDYLLSLLFALDGVIQSPRYHPESDALYHSLQVFEQAHKHSTDPELWLAALFHDIGKSVNGKHHAQIGAEMVTGIFSERVVWLILHHLDLLKSPKKLEKH